MSNEAEMSLVVKAEAPASANARDPKKEIRIIGPSHNDTVRHTPEPLNCPFCRGALALKLKIPGTCPSRYLVHFPPTSSTREEKTDVCSHAHLQRDLAATHYPRISVRGPGSVCSSVCLRRTVSCYNTWTLLWLAIPQHGLRGPEGAMERGGGPRWRPAELERVS